MEHIFLTAKTRWFVMTSTICGEGEEAMTWVTFGHLGGAIGEQPHGKIPQPVVCVETEFRYSSPEPSCSVSKWLDSVEQLVK